MKAFNLLIRFLLELAALAALGFSGYHSVEPDAGRIALAIAAPVIFGVAWGLTAAPKAYFKLPRGQRAVVGFLLLELSAGALAAAGELQLAVLFAAVITINAVMLHLWKQ